ncbi:MAG TPA: MauE/DoxX family redox-associated membrane protein [Candidatus Limnocylindria bacterium]|nr:MauE/DoxX family redox-associated membrane protein [Candidatus Limnocylindria bacterium]
MQQHDDIEQIFIDNDDLPASSDSKGARDHHSMTGGSPAVESREEYKKLGYVLLGILIVSSMLTFIRGIELDRFLADFMAVFFITFAAFKFYDLEGFAHAYRSYDILAKRIRPWGYIFPFIEAFMGFWYLLSDGPNNLNVLAMAVTGTAAVGVFKEVKRKSRFHCACLGTFIRLPLSRVSLIENVTMFVMAAAMLVI